ncbi:4'-phosphopantetheinyl transferase family protein [Nocardiopsis lambiniae]|uniref:4'-phosphopantetheinyl transferase superfamily protein n=1 Tax=Nocardiopsis lambiniae TaxID=3075539 RepID=A0ABU2MA20_9ACTN|nr:4'-phosphopantetheinyl transferase superfamily protein [Nocardiopsis sp. DSM 44743]MDT0329454.1 4'-phosphopantetheinyl transferase superfamily protein [Nocardiopsis sp. DSM 44743]
MTLPRLTPEVWWAHTSSAMDRLSDLLDERERARGDRFLHKADRDRHLLGRAMARSVLAERVGCDPREVTFELRCRSCDDKELAGAERDSEPHGKPHPTGAAAGWEISVSHSGDWVVLVLAEGVPVGVDVERVAESRDLEGLAAYTLSDTEHETWKTLSSDARVGAFFGYWARKEALLKATGLGLSGGLRRVTVSPPHADARLVSWTGGGVPEASWLTDLERGEGYRAAFAALTDRPVTPVLHPPSATLDLLRR